MQGKNALMQMAGREPVLQMRSAPERCFGIRVGSAGKDRRNKLGKQSSQREYMKHVYKKQETEKNYKLLNRFIFRRLRAGLLL